MTPVNTSLPNAPLPEDAKDEGSAESVHASMPNAPLPEDAKGDGFAESVHASMPNAPPPEDAKDDGSAESVHASLPNAPLPEDAKGDGSAESVHASLPNAPLPEGSTRCGFVAVIGAPNAGKSTLVNQLVGQKVSIVSPKVQTTRTRFMGIALQDTTQIMLMDTPGIFQPRRRLDRAMVKAAWESMTDADRVLLIIDSRQGLDETTERILTQAMHEKTPVSIVLNKTDITKKTHLLSLAKTLSTDYNFHDIYMISASKGDGVAALKTMLAQTMPQGPWHFPEDQVANISLRLLAEDITREQIYCKLYEELPYASMVQTEKWQEKKDGSVEIRHQILVERPSQKAIILGKAGQKIKNIGVGARLELEKMLKCRVHLFLHVRVQPGWADDKNSYKAMGLNWVD